MGKTQKVSTCLWFDTQAEEAARFYTSLLPNSRITSISRYGKGAPMPEGTPLTVTFTLDGTEFMGLNGGLMFTHSEAASITVKCNTQDEIDRIWSALTADGGSEQQCFWLKDRYGLSWQIVPAQIGEWMNSGDPVVVARVMSVIMASVKPNVAALEKAYAG